MTSSSLDGVPRIWLGVTAPNQQFRFFRKTIETASPAGFARIELFAQSRYHLWINGEYCGRGPVFHHPHRRPVAVYDVTRRWRVGRNVVAVSVYEPNIAVHNAIPDGEPGVIARIEVRDQGGAARTWVTDASWRATDRTGWSAETPRRGWALAYVESFHARDGQPGWQEIDFDDSSWSAAEVYSRTEVPGAQWIGEPTPPLRGEWRPFAELVGIYHAGAEVPDLLAKEPTYGAALREEKWEPRGDFAVEREKPSDPNLPWAQAPKEPGNGLEPLTIDGLTPNRATAVCVDLGREYVGQVCFECECPTEGIIDVGWSEYLLGGRPSIFVKGFPYADRIQAGPGKVVWEPVAFSGARYVAVILRGFTGSVTFRKLGMRATEPDLDWAGHFACGDKRLADVFSLCARCLRIGTQEAVMDCPTREQAPYLGDGNPEGKWIAMLTGDARHWKYVVRESFVRQSRDGLLRAAFFTGVRTSLIDYNLIAVLAAREYLEFTGDEETLREVLEGCRRVFKFFDAQRDDAGLLQVDCTKRIDISDWEHRYDPDFDDAGKWLLVTFIDHPGTGWHNVNEPGLARNGIMAALHAIYVMALEALALIEERVGDASAAPGMRQRAEQTRRAAAGAFYCPERKVFVDVISGGRQSAQISEQTNVWCVMAGFIDDERGRELIERLHTSDDPQLARGGPYFWCYTLPLMARLGLHGLAVREIGRKWGVMLDLGATALWETFAGDSLDTWCHPWSAAPLEFLLHHVLGLPVTGRPADWIELRPRPDLLPDAEGSVVLPAGEVSIRWSATNGKITLEGELPPGVNARLVGPSGVELGTVSGGWKIAI